MLLLFAGFHRQSSSGLLRGLLHLGLCKSHSASGIELEITTFRKLWLYFFYFEFCSFFGQKIFLWPALSVATGRTHSISRHRPRKSSTCCDFVASTQAFVAKAGTACEHWCLYTERHRPLLRVPLTHVLKPAFTKSAHDCLVFIGDTNINVSEDSRVSKFNNADF